MHAAHEYGVVHRDIKPSNLMLDGDGKLWVTDFGLARCQSDATLTKTGDVVGTLRYMSPEQALGQTARVDQRTDVYSLGATLYELLTLRPAFPGQDGPTLMRQIEQQEPVRLRQWQPESPPIWRRSSSRRWPNAGKTATPRPSSWRTTCPACWKASPRWPSHRRSPIGSTNGHAATGVWSEPLRASACWW